MPSSYKVTRLMELESLQTGRLGQRDTVVFYILTTGEGENRVTQEFTVRLPKDDPTPQEVLAAVQADARRRSQVLGASGTV